MAKTKRPSGSAARPERPAAIALERRPYPPAELIGAEGIMGAHRFVPAPDLRDWMMATFIARDGVLRNDEHWHLQDAKLGVLWTNVPNSRHGRTIVGQAEIMPPAGAMGKWQKARIEIQIETWFDGLPDFLLTFYAPYAADCDDASFCALVEHELYHCGQERDEFGAPKFDRAGLPKYAIRGHDVEEFVGVVRRYGAKASNAADLIEAARKPPEITRAELDWACGTCSARAA